eukprot:359568-Chlamydomonas_euryale.AAC.1
MNVSQLLVVPPSGRTRSRGRGSRSPPQPRSKRPARAARLTRRGMARRGATRSQHDATIRRSHASGAVFGRAAAEDSRTSSLRRSRVGSFIDRRMSIRATRYAASLRGALVTPCRKQASKGGAKRGREGTEGREGDAAQRDEAAQTKRRPHHAESKPRRLGRRCFGALPQNSPPRQLSSPLAHGP